MEFTLSNKSRECFEKNLTIRLLMNKFLYIYIISCKLQVHCRNE